MSYSELGKAEHATDLVEQMGNFVSDVTSVRCFITFDL